jgi:hypothetical protein
VRKAGKVRRVGRCERNFRVQISEFKFQISENPPDKSTFTKVTAGQAGGLSD